VGAEVGGDVGVGEAECEGVGEADCEGVGEEVGDGDGLGLGVDVLVTGGATPGGTVAPEARSCCQDHPTDPPAGTVSAPALEEEYAHDAFEPSAHQRPQ
jgi:hypothetical protein